MFKKMENQIILPQVNYSEFTENFEVNYTKQGGGKQETEKWQTGRMFSRMDALTSLLAASFVGPCISKYQPHLYVLIPWVLKILSVMLLLCGVPSVSHVSERLSQGAKNFITGVFSQTVFPGMTSLNP